MNNYLDLYDELLSLARDLRQLAQVLQILAENAPAEIQELIADKLKENDDDRSQTIN